MISPPLKLSTAMALLATATLGVSLVLFAEWLEGYEPLKCLHLFNLFGLAGKAWFFGRREIVHLVGFIGCVLAAWPLIHSCSYKGVMLIHIPFAIVSILLACWYYSAYQDWAWAQSIYPGATRIGVMTGPVGYLLTGAALPLIYRFGSVGIRGYIARGILPVMVCSLVISLLWELIYEPFMRACDWSTGVHPTPWKELDQALVDFDWNRAWVQWCQVIVDIGSILFASWICLRIRMWIAPALTLPKAE